MVESRVCDRVLLVETGDRWRTAIVSMFGYQIPIDSISVEQFSFEDVRGYQLIAIEFSQHVVENCSAVFDKIDLSVENRFAILLGAPNILSDRNVFRELGFVAFVDEVGELGQLERLYQLSTKMIQPVVGWRNELESQIPWPEFATGKSKKLH